jgi:hypothetical protein
MRQGYCRFQPLLHETNSIINTSCVMLGAVSVSGANGAAALPPLTVPKPKATTKWALQEADFGPGLVGGKSANLAKLRGKVCCAEELAIAIDFLTS